MCVKMAYIHVGHPSGTLWGRWSFTSAALIGSSFIGFCHAFPDRKVLDLSRGKRLGMLLGFVLAALTMTPWVLRHMGTSGNGGIQPQYGPLYPAFSVFLLGAFGQGLWTLLRKWRVARGRSRQQMRYLCAGLALAIGAGVTTNLLIPTLTGSSRFSNYGPYFTLVFVGLTAHAIIRHRLMDIRIVMRQGVTYGLSLGSTLAVMWVVLIGLDTYFRLSFSLDALGLILTIGMSGVVIFRPLQVMFQRVFDRYCYRASVDYRQATGATSQELAGLVRLQPLCAFLADFILHTLKIEAVAVYVRAERDRFECRASDSVSGAYQVPAAFSASALTAFIAHVGKPVVRDELSRWVDEVEVERFTAGFNALHSDVIVPVLVENQLVACITVAGKLSGDAFYTRDLELLGTLAHQASVALRRAQLYEEITWMKEYNENILRQTHSGVIAINRKGLVTMINAAAAHLLDVEDRDLTGGSVTELLPEAISTPLLLTVVGPETYTNQEATLHLPNRRSVPIGFSTSVLHDAEGELSGAIVVFHDLSRLKELEQDKRRAKRLASIGTFVSGMAHEIKNPLVAIKTLAELLPEQYDDEEFRDTFTKVALHEVERIDTLIQRLRSMGGSRAPMHRVDVTTVLTETLDLISGELEKWHIGVEYTPPEHLPLIYGDHDQLKQVCLNLCLNSLEAMEQDGTLTVTLDLDDACDERSAALVLRFSDTGPGIPAECFATLFEPFVTSKHTGSGLGLAICRGIVEYHRGTIHASNRIDGPGSTFTVRLPIDHRAAPALAEVAVS